MGGDESNILVKEWVSELPFKELGGDTHLEIAKNFDLLDFQNAAKITGNKFVFLKNEAALLELALTNWVVNLVTKKGYEPVLTPDLARKQYIEACGFQPRDPASQFYHIEGMDECLVGTSEIPLAAMYSNEIVSKDLLPHKMVGFSHCFRAEAGKGQHSHGLYRLH